MARAGEQTAGDLWIELADDDGKTRRGGLVFDVADLVKDAHILPQAFVSAQRGDSEQDFRSACIESLTRGEALDFMIDTLQTVAQQLGRQAQVNAVQEPPTP